MWWLRRRFHGAQVAQSWQESRQLALRRCSWQPEGGGCVAELERRTCRRSSLERLPSAASDLALATLMGVMAGGGTPLSVDELALVSERISAATAAHVARASAHNYSPAAWRLVSSAVVFACGIFAVVLPLALVALCWRRPRRLGSKLLHKTSPRRRGSPWPI